MEMSLYEMNKQLMVTQPECTVEEIAEGLKQIAQVAEASLERNKYWALFSHENRDFTVFRLSRSSNTNSSNVMARQVGLCLGDRGAIKSIDYKEDINSFEIWIDDKFYALFPYDNGVIECNK